MDDQTKTNIINMAEQKRIENLSKQVIDKNKELQRELASKTLGKMVIDIIELTDEYGDSVLVWVYVDQGTRDLVQNQKVIVMILWPTPACHPKFIERGEGNSCKKLGVRFEELRFGNGKLWDSQGENFIINLQRGGYPY